MIRNLNKGDKDLFYFGRKYGGFGYCNLDNRMSYYCKAANEYFLIPDSVSDEELESLCKKSMKDDKNYVYELAKKDWQKIDYASQYDEHIKI